MNPLALRVISNGLLTGFRKEKSDKSNDCFDVFFSDRKRAILSDCVMELQKLMIIFFCKIQEWTRRKLYYEWSKEVCEKTESAEMKELIKKHLAKDMKQAQLADIVNEVQKIIEDSYRKRK